LPAKRGFEPGKYRGNHQEYLKEYNSANVQFAWGQAHNLCQQIFEGSSKITNLTGAEKNRKKAKYLS